MKRFLTKSGGIITAANEEAAKAIAVEYDMGEVVGPAPEPKPRKRKITGKLRPIGIWCEATQTWDMSPTHDYKAVVLEWFYEEQDRTSRIAALGHNGCPAQLTILERMAFNQARSS